MQKIDFDAKYFNPKDVLECGQIFRFKANGDGSYTVCSRDMACRIKCDGIKTVVECENDEYFYNYFDLTRDYAAIIQNLKNFKIPVLDKSLALGQGLRILNQDAEETIFSFILSQNNNIPRIKSIIEKICKALGERRELGGEEYYTFPSAEKLASRDADFYRSLGAGYRDVFIVSCAKRIADEGVEKLKSLDGAELKKALLTYHGVGPKVADCVALFGFGKATSFPVDTWIEKLYREDFGGTLTDRRAINAYLCDMFGDLAGYAQQYLFYGKRSLL